MSKIELYTDISVQPLSDRVRQRLDLQIEAFIQQQLPQLGNQQQFRQVFDAFMQFGQDSGSSVAQISQQMLQRNQAKLQPMQQFQQHLEQLEKKQGAVQQSWLQRFGLMKKVQHSVELADFYAILTELDAQQAQLTKDHLYLQREQQQILSAAHLLQQYDYLCQGLLGRLNTQGMQEETSLWHLQAQQEIHDYLEHKQQNLLQQRQLNSIALHSIALMLQQHQATIEALFNVEQRLKTLLKILAQIEQNQIQQQLVQQKCAELKTAIAIYQQWLEVQHGSN